ncbi:host specificity J domain protein, partial [Escherichia coli EC1849]|jgi:hypothetical protein
VCWR